MNKSLDLFIEKGIMWIVAGFIFGGFFYAITHDWIIGVLMLISSYFLVEALFENPKKSKKGDKK